MVDGEEEQWVRVEGFVPARMFGELCVVHPKELQGHTKSLGPLRQNDVKNTYHGGNSSAN